MESLSKISGLSVFIFLSVSLAASSFPLVEKAEAAFGISPPFMNADHLVPGSKYIQTVYLVQDQPNEDLKIQAELDINERVRKWITVAGGKEIVIPKGTRQYAVDIAVQVPKDAGLGVYHGNLRFVGVPAQAGQVTIALGVQVAINLTVGTGIYRNFSVPLVRFLDIEEGWGPRVYLKVDNQGNVPEDFDKESDRTVFEVFDKYGASRLSYHQKEKGFLPEIPPFSIEEHTIEFPPGLYLTPGQYWGSFELFQEGKVIASQRTVFNVLKKGSLSNPGALILRSIKENWPYYLGGVVLVTLGWRFRRRLFRRK